MVGMRPTCRQCSVMKNHSVSCTPAKPENDDTSVDSSVRQAKGSFARRYEIARKKGTRVTKRRFYSEVTMETACQTNAIMGLSASRSLSGETSAANQLWIICIKKIARENCSARLPRPETGYQPEVSMETTMQDQHH